MGPTDAVVDADRLAVVARLGLIDTPPEPVFDEFARVVARLLDAPYAFVTVVDDLRSFWKAAHGLPGDQRADAVEASFCQYVIRSRADLLVGDAATDPLTSDNPSITTMGVRAWAGAPITVDGQVIGSFCVVDSVPRNWTDEDRQILRAFRDQVEREFAHRHALQVQQAAHRADAQSLSDLRAELVPVELPRVPGVGLAARHRAATDGNDVLGDFYDGFVIDDRRWGIVLGDVCGHGAAAARLTALVRYTLRSAVLRAEDPADAVAELNTTLCMDRTDPGRFATLTYVEIDVDQPSSIRRVSAGHPAPLLRRPDGTVHVLSGANSTPVGLVADATYASETLDLEPGSVLLLYTDGLTDARDSDGEPFGESALRDLVAVAPARTADELVDHIADSVLTFAADNLLDDVAVVAVRFG